MRFVHSKNLTPIIYQHLNIYLLEKCNRFNLYRQKYKIVESEYEVLYEVLTNSKVLPMGDTELVTVVKSPKYQV